MNCQKSRELAYKIRLHALEMTSRGGTSHIASIFSMADLVAVLYADVLRYDPNNPRMPERDRLILSKGHAGAGIYAALAESGFFPVEELLTHCQNCSRLSGHVSHKGVPGVEASTGSLGQGMPMAMGMAMAAKLNHEEHRVYCIIGDGECDEGAIWESALIAHQYKLDNFIVVIDANDQQVEGRIEDQMTEEPLIDRFTSFGAVCVEANGHDIEDFCKACETPHEGKPLVVIARTHGWTGVKPLEKPRSMHFIRIGADERDEFQKIYDEM